jgi:hypothetical protein
MPDIDQILDGSDFASVGGKCNCPLCKGSKSLLEALTLRAFLQAHKEATNEDHHKAQKAHKANGKVKRVRKRQ